MKPRRAAPAFTLVELLVTIGIIAALAVLSGTVFAKVRSRGEAATCINNLRVLAAANITYAAEHDGQLVPAQSPDNLTRWHGTRTEIAAKFEGDKGPLSPYLGQERRIKICPTFRNALKGHDTFEEATGGYGYNATYLGGTPADRWTGERLGNIPRPARTIMFTDTAFPRENGIQEYPYCEPWQWVDRRGKLRGKLDPSVHFRHHGNTNVAWADGHITAEPPTTLGKTNFYGGNAEIHKIGWLGPEEDNGYWKP